jgi:hypothetical protein
MHQNPLIFYGLVELSFILVSLAGFCYWKLRELHKRMDASWGVLAEVAENCRGNIQRHGNQVLIDATSGFLDALDNLVVEKPPGTAKSWRRLREAALQYPMAVEGDPYGQQQMLFTAEQRDLDEMMQQQCLRIDALVHCKNQLLQILHDRFKTVQHTNDELMSGMQRISQHPAEANELRDMAARLQASSENLQAVFDELGQAKMLFESHLEALGKSNHRLRVSNELNRAKIHDLIKQKELGDAKIVKLRIKLEQCVQNGNKLQCRYEELQKYYLKLLK